MNKIDFRIEFCGEYVTGYMDEDGEVFYCSPIDGESCKIVGNPYRDTEIDYLKEKESNFDFLLDSTVDVDIVPHLLYWGDDCNRKVTINNQFGTLEEVILIINPIE